jgi:hypothetical protein
MKHKNLVFTESNFTTGTRANLKMNSTSSHNVMQEVI